MDRDILFGWSIFGRSSEVVYEEGEEKTKFSYKADLSDFVGLYYFDIDSWNRTDGVVRFSFSRQARSDLNFISRIQAGSLIQESKIWKIW